MSQLDVVTGAFSYSGAAIAAELQRRGHRVRTLTGHPARAPAGSPVEVRPLDFGDEPGLAESMAGAHTLYNTYWVRFAHGAVSHETAVANSRVLFAAAVKAGVRRLVHVSITHPGLDSRSSYFRGKAQVEQALAESGVPGYAIARPAILFGGDGVLINNIAWLLRRLPVFAIGGRGDYRIRPIHVRDLATLCADLGEQHRPGDQGRRREQGRPGERAARAPVVVDAVGPESVSFRQLVEQIRSAVHSRSLIVPVPGAVVPVLGGLLNVALRDTLLTADEYWSMAAGLADSAAPATGQIAITDWVREHAASLGRSYANELDRHYRPAQEAGTA
jgi:NADH dehydrogenase